MKTGECARCFKRRKLVKAWVCKNIYEWTCIQCLEDDEDGYVIVI